MVGPESGDNRKVIVCPFCAFFNLVVPIEEPGDGGVITVRYVRSGLNAHQIKWIRENPDNPFVRELKRIHDEIVEKFVER